MTVRDQCPEVLDHYQSFFQSVLLPKIFNGLGIPSQLTNGAAKFSNYPSAIAGGAHSAPAANRSLWDEAELLD